MWCQRWDALTTDERRGCTPFRPDLVVELASPSDYGPRGPNALHRKMAAHQVNGAQLSLPLTTDQQMT